MKKVLVKFADGSTYVVMFGEIKGNYCNMCGLSKVEAFQLVLCGIAKEARRMENLKGYEVIVCLDYVSQIADGAPFQCLGRVGSKSEK